MKLLIDIIVTFLLVFWPMVLFTSVMMLGGPGATENLSNVLTVVLVVAYPIYIFILYLLLGQPYFKLSPKSCLIAATIVVVLAQSIFGYFGLLWKNLNSSNDDNAAMNNKEQAIK